MDIERWDPWTEIEAVQEQVDRLFVEVLEKLRTVLPGREISFVPVTDIVETEQEFQIFVSLPGVIEEDIDVSLEDQVLVIRGEREAPYDLRRTKEGQTVAHLRQWRYGYFERRISLPLQLRTEAVQATCEAGVLTIKVSKPQ